MTNGCVVRTSDALPTRVALAQVTKTPASHWVKIRHQWLNPPRILDECKCLSAIMRDWRWTYSVKYIVPSRIRMITKGDREFPSMAGCRAIASRKDLRNCNNDARKNAPLGNTSQSIVVRGSWSLTSKQNVWNPLVYKLGSCIKLDNSPGH